MGSGGKGDGSMAPLLPYMPVGGWKFYDSEAPNDAQERARADALIDRLVAYLRSIQEP